VPVAQLLSPRLDRVSPDVRIYYLQCITCDFELASSQVDAFCLDPVDFVLSAAWVLYCGCTQDRNVDSRGGGLQFLSCITALALSLGVHPELLLCVVTRNTCTGIDVPSLIDTTSHAGSPGIWCHLQRPRVFVFAVDQHVCIPLEHQHVSTLARRCSCCTRRHVLCIRHRRQKTLAEENHWNMRKLHFLAPWIARLVLIYWTRIATNSCAPPGTSAMQV
jgi:hypothetical protein